MIIQLIFVRLLEEGTDVWRPTQAESLGDSCFRVLAPPGYDAEDESWEFVPGSIVVCRSEVRWGEAVLIADRLAGSI